jgi:hypothetical protein
VCGVLLAIVHHMSELISNIMMGECVGYAVAIRLFTFSSESTVARSSGNLSRKSLHEDSKSAEAMIAIEYIFFIFSVISVRYNPNLKVKVNWRAIGTATPPELKNSGLVR